VYERTLELLARAAKHRGAKIGATKSGIMVGLGETMEQLDGLMEDLRTADVDIFTIGQYLKPTQRHLPVQKYYSPEEFKRLYDMAMAHEFVYVESGPLVRSSYHANRASEAMEALLAGKQGDGSPATSG
jgi:lipoic acid synthetase